MEMKTTGRKDTAGNKGSLVIVAVLLLAAVLAFKLVRDGISLFQSKEPQKEIVYIYNQPENNSSQADNESAAVTKPDLEIGNKMTNSGSKFTEILKPTSNVKDNYGKEYRNAYVVNTWGDPSIYVTVNEEYSYIQGSFAVQKKQAEAFNHFMIRAYDEDGTEIYTSQTLYADNPDGLFISIPVSGSRTVRIKFSGCDRYFNSVDVICTGLFFSNQR